MTGRLTARSLAAAATAVAMASCVTVQSSNVTYGPGRASQPGYAVEYLEAIPSPGTPVVQGSVVKFRVKVRYLLATTERGRLQIQFADQNGQPLLEGNEAAIEIGRTGWTTAELSKEVTIPAERWDLVLHVYVIPEGESRPTGELRIRYPVAAPRQEATIS